MSHTYWPFVAIAIGILSGASSGAFGIGGGVVNKPLLRLFLRVSPGFVIGSPIPAQFLGACIGSISYYRRRMINFRLVRIAAPAAIVGTGLGAYATKFLNVSYLMVLLVLVVLWAGGRVVAKSFTFREEDMSECESLNIYTASITAFIAGVTAGLLGLGGGFVLVPAFHLVLRRELKECIASSLLIVAMTAVPNGAIHWILGHINWSLALSIVIGQMIGVWFGTLFTVKSHRKLVSLVFGIFLVVVSLAMARLEIMELIRGG